MKHHIDSHWLSCAVFNQEIDLNSSTAAAMNCNTLKHQKFELIPRREVWNVEANLVQVPVHDFDPFEQEKKSQLNWKTTRSKTLFKLKKWCCKSKQEMVRKPAHTVLRVAQNVPPRSFLLHAKRSNLTTPWWNGFTKNYGLCTTSACSFWHEQTTRNSESLNPTILTMANSFSVSVSQPGNLSLPLAGLLGRQKIQLPNPKLR